MAFDWKLILRRAWICCCVLGTLMTLVWQCNNFYRGEDETIIEYRVFNQMETDVYPSLGLFWTLPIDEENLHEYGKKFNPSNYARFLLGGSDDWDKDVLTVDYDKVTPHLDDYVHRYGYRLSSQDDDWRDLYDRNSITLGNKTGYKEHSIFTAKGFTIDIPFKKDVQMNGFYVYFDASIFGKQGRLSNPIGNMFTENQFRLVLHYPNQFIAKADFGIRNWPVRSPGSSKHYLIRITVGHIEVRVRRNTFYKPCIEGIPDYDEMVKTSMLEKAGCSPPFLNSSPQYGPCTYKEQLWNAWDIYAGAMVRGNRRPHDMVNVPCRILEMINYDVKDVETPDAWIKDYPRLNTSVGVILDFTEFTYKEVRSVRAMDVQALIGKVHLFAPFSGL